MNYNPADATECLPGGDYEAVLTKTEERQSKKGNDMIDLTWTVFQADTGRTFLVHDYIVNPSTLFKMKHLAKALGKTHEFKAAAFQPADYIDHHVTLQLGIKSQSGFDDKNVIDRYKEPPTAKFTAPPTVFQQPAEDQIPF